MFISDLKVIQSALEKVCDDFVAVFGRILTSLLFFSKKRKREDQPLKVSSSGVFARDPSRRFSQKGRRQRTSPRYSQHNQLSRKPSSRRQFGWNDEESVYDSPYFENRDGPELRL